MADADRVREDTMSASQRRAAEAAEIERKMKELLVFRNAGVLTESELEDQKARLHWA